MGQTDELQKKVKQLEQLLLEKDQEITSLSHKLSVMETDLDKAEGKVAEFKTAQLDGEASKMTVEGLTRKIQLLEEELDAAEKHAKEVVEKYVSR